MERHESAGLDVAGQSHCMGKSSLVITRYEDSGQLDEITREIDLELTQVSSGRFEGRTVRAKTANVAMQRSKLPLTTICRGAVEAGDAAILLPMRWSGELKWNGMVIERPSPVMFHGEYFRRSSDLEIVGFVVNLETLKTTAAALAGVAPDEIKAPDGVIRAPRRHVEALTMAMVELAQRCDNDQLLRADPMFGELAGRRVTAASAELLASVHAPSSDSTSKRMSRKRIVRLAEERFEAAGDASVSLVDLCMAAGVSARTLQYAFREYYGLSPTAYFRMRRFNRARHSLRNAAPDRGAVKRAALDAGITELGRFSVEYRRLFGESPSVTLSRAAG